MQNGPQPAQEGKKKCGCFAPLFDCLRKKVDTDGDGKIEAHELGDAVETVVEAVASVTPREGNVGATEEGAPPKKESPRK